MLSAYREEPSFNLVELRWRLVVTDHVWAGMSGGCIG